MRVILRPVLLSLITFAILPAWRSSRGQDGVMVAAVSDETPQPQQSPSKPTSGPQQTSAPPASPASTLQDTVDAGEMDDDMEEPRRGMAHWNEYRGPHITARAGMGLLLDTASYAQDDVSKEQIAMLPTQRLRDFRFVLGGSFPSL